MKFDVSIVVITKDRREDLARCLDSLREMDSGGHHVEIVVVEECAEPTPMEGVKYVSIPVANRGWGYARNVGVDHAPHDMIVFTDDDCVVEKQWLSRLLKPMEDKRVFGVTGGVRVKDCGAIGYCENVLGFPNGGLLRIHRANGKTVPAKHISTCNCAYRREVFEKAGRFVEDVNTRGEDTELADRVTALYECRFVPSATVYHKPRGTLRKIFLWFVERGKSNVRLVPFVGCPKKHALYHAKNSLTLRVVVLAALIFMAGDYGWHVAGLGVGLYYLLMLRRYAFQWKYGKRWDVFLLTPVVKFVMDAGMEIGMLGELTKKSLKNKRL